jgi:putative spermidine/putrescine transport system substrate-binding protein
MPARITRRRFTAGLGAAASLGALPLRHARGGDGQVVVGTWGGDYQNLLQRYIADPELSPKGIATIFDTANDTVRRTKLLAEKRLPHGSMDIAALNAAGSYEMWRNGALAEIDPARLPNWQHVPEKLRTKYSVPHIYSGRVMLYNPTKIKTPPTSYNDLWNPAYKDRVGIIDIQYLVTIESAALISGGGLSNYEPGKAKLLELKKQGFKMYPTNEAMAQALKTEECWMCIMWKARGVMWQNAGVPVEIAYPKEGVVLYVSDMTLPKNARNKDAAYAWLNATLAPQPQREFAQNMGYNPTIDNAELPPDLAARIGFDKETQEGFLLQDQEYIAKTDADLQEWWNKVLKG